MSNNKNYTNLINMNNEFHPTKKTPGNSHSLPPGSYMIKSDPEKWWFEQFDLKFDSILNLPSDEFQFVTQQFSQFLKPETKEQFKKYGFLYKRSALLHGKWGTGKSVITSRIAEEVIRDYNGICLFLKSPAEVRVAFNVLNDLQENTPVIVILEELDEIIRTSERDLLTLLDGAVQKDNVMFLATTNHIEKIPKRILRPGRFGLVVKVKYPNVAARKMYFETKLGKDFKDIDTFVQASNGLSVDELKEIIMSCVIFKEELEETVSRLKKTRDNVHSEDDDMSEDKDDTYLNDMEKSLELLMSPKIFTYSTYVSTPSGVEKAAEMMKNNED